MTEVKTQAAGLTEEQIDALTLDEGAHESPESGHCLLEVVSMFAGENFSDSPACVDPVLAAFGRIWNDGLTDAQRQKLKVYIKKLPGTAAGSELSRVRGWMAADWIIRVSTPAWLALHPETAEYSVKLRALAPVTDEKRLATAHDVLVAALIMAEAVRDTSLAAAGGTVREDAKETNWVTATCAIRDAVWALTMEFMGAARAATGAAAWAALDKAMAAAWHTACAVSWDDAMEAAMEAKVKCVAEYSAWRKAAGAYFAQTRGELQESVHDLYLRMINARLDSVTAQDRTDEVHP